MAYTHFSTPLYTGDGHYLDLSFLSSSPAGTHGFVRVIDGRLTFENHIPVRFWGVNLVGGDCFPEKEDALKIAKRLSLMGCNLVRLHHLDAPWAQPNIFGTDQHSLSLSKNSLDKLDYLFHCLKENGIYLFLDLLVHRKFGRTEGFEEGEVLLGGKQAAFFDPKLISLQKEYMRQLLTHHNPYTGLSYANDPALVACLIINESSIFTTTTGSHISEEHLKMLTSLRAKPNKTPVAKYNVDYTQPGGGYYPEKGQGDSQEFLLNLEKAYYDNMYHFLKIEIGFQPLLLGSNFPFPMISNIYANSQMDASAVNVYWDHPDLSSVNHDWDKVEEANILNRSILKQQHYYYNSLVHLAVRFKLKDKPLMITEWNACKPNEYILEAMPYMAAYARLQAWDACCLYSFEQCLQTPRKFSSFNIAHRPDLLAMWTLATLMYSKDYLREAQTTLTQQWNISEPIEAPNRDFLIDNAPLLPFHVRLQHEFVASGAQKIEAQTYQSLPLPEGSPVSVDFRQGNLELRADHVQGIIGCFNNREYDLPFFKFKVENDFCALVAVSLDGKAFKDKCEHLLLIAVPQTKEDIKEGKLHIEEMKGHVIFKHDFRSRRILPRPLYLHKKNGSDHIHLKLRNDGMLMFLSGHISDFDQKTIESAFIYEVNIEY